MNKKDIKNFHLKELESEIISIGAPRYRARQIFCWLYKKGVEDFKDMKNLPKEFLDKLSRDFFISDLELSECIKSKDKTEKFLFKLSDGNYIESVLILSQKRKTLCLSTQVGCRFSCLFCASGKIGFIRDLAAGEIINQILYLTHKLKHRITNYVFMGMGEPLDNYQNTINAILIMNEKDALNIGARRITISTCGIIPAIDKLKDLGLQINLSISLHATNDEVRARLMPITKLYPLQELIRACKRYIEKKGRFITLEYILIKNKNHSKEDANRLAEIAKKLNAKVNLLEYSEIKGIDFKPPSKKDIELFRAWLENKKISVTLRKSKGKDIEAACGQLAGRKNNK